MEDLIGDSELVNPSSANTPSRKHQDSEVESGHRFRFRVTSRRGYIEGCTPLEQPDEALTIKMQESSADEFQVPMHLVEMSLNLHHHVRDEIQRTHPHEPAQHVRCLVCQLRELIPDSKKREQMVQFLIISEAHTFMFRNTPQYKLCQECGGRLPLGKDRLGRERDCEFF